MKNICFLVLVLFLVIPDSSHAVWSAFYSLNHTNISSKANHHDIKVTIRPTLKGTNYFRVSVSSRPSNLGYWLVAAKKPLLPEAQKFRGQLGFFQPREDVELLTQLQPNPEALLQVKTAITPAARNPKTDRKGVAVILHRDTIRRAYIYMDHESLKRLGAGIVDGGAFYSIDPPKFFEQFERK